MDKTKTFWQYFWDDKSNRVYVGFCVAFAAIFHGIGSVVCDMTLNDIYPMYILLAAIGMTLVTYEWRKYSTYKSNKEAADEDFFELDNH